jgi:four helix bundle suffix protein
VAQWVREEHDRGRDGQSGPGGQKTTATFPELAANAALVLLAVACSLLDRQLAAQASAFETEGGFTERLYRVRSANRSSSTRSTKCKIRCNLDSKSDLNWTPNPVRTGHPIRF